MEPTKKLMALMCFLANKLILAKQPTIIAMVKKTRLIRVRRLLRPEKDDHKRKRKRRGSKLGTSGGGESDDEYDSGSDVEGGKAHHSQDEDDYDEDIEEHDHEHSHDENDDQ